MAKNLARLAAYTGHAQYDEAARRTLSLLSAALEQVPQAFGEALSALDLLVNGIDEVAVLGGPSDPRVGALLEAIQTPYRPGVVTALAANAKAADSSAVPLLRGRGLVQGEPAVYVCRQFTCQMPVTTPDAVARLLDGMAGPA
jgi:uncharacterized protein YyaL (SSP411 family)